MPDEARVHPIYFDSEINGDFTDMGIPYRIVDVDAGLDLMLPLHLSGVFQYRVVNEGLLKMYGEAEGFLQRSLLNSLPGVLADSEGSFGLPKELPTHAKEIGDALVSRLSWTWTDRFGVVLEQFAVTDCRLTSQSRTQLERVLLALHADDELRTRLGLAPKKKPAGEKPPGHSSQSTARPQGTHSAQQPKQPQAQAPDLQQVVSKIVSSWQAAVEKSKSSAIPNTPPGTKTGAPMWRCPRCGRWNAGRFCSECGSRRIWFCPRCGNRNTSNFCMRCGFKEP